MNIEITQQNKYVKCKYVMKGSYVLNIYVLSLLDFSNLNFKKTLIR